MLRQGAVKIAKFGHGVAVHLEMLEAQEYLVEYLEVAQRRKRRHRQPRRNLIFQITSLI